MDLPAPCPRCNWKYGGFHVCTYDLRTKEGRKRATAPEGHVARVMTARENREVNDLVISLYKEGHGMRKIAVRKDVPYSYRIVNEILHDAAARGEVEIKPRGVTNRWNKQPAPDATGSMAR